MEEKNNKWLIWLVISLIIVVVGLVTYIVCDKFVLIDNNDNNDSNDNNITEPIKKQETISEEELNKYLSYVPLSTISADAYSEIAVNINTINKKTVLFSVFYNNSTEKNSDENSEYLGCVLEQDFNIMLEKMYNVKINDFSSEIKESEEWFEDFLILKDGYYCQLGHGAMKEKSNEKITSYEFIKDELVIKETIGFIYSGVGESSIWNGNELVKRCIYIENSNPNCMEQAEAYIKENIEEFNTYKHIFKKNTDETFYWHSTELVE